MQTEPIEIYSHSTNACVVRMPERNFPGIVMQGDSLAIQVASAIELVERMEGKVDEETFLLALTLAEQLELQLLHYEDVLIAHDIPFPYERDVNKNTVRFKRYWGNADEGY